MSRYEVNLNSFPSVHLILASILRWASTRKLDCFSRSLNGKYQLRNSSHMLFLLRHNRKSPIYLGYTSRNFYKCSFMHHSYLGKHADLGCPSEGLPSSSTIEAAVSFSVIQWSLCWPYFTAMFCHIPYFSNQTKLVEHLPNNWGNSTYQ